jgi:hypothetical protein
MEQGEKTEIDKNDETLCGQLRLTLHTSFLFRLAVEILG